jgi:hypothetical protein
MEGDFPMANHLAADKPSQDKPNRKVARSAKSGEFVTKDFAKKHPSTTVVETIKSKETKEKS